MREYHYRVDRAGRIFHDGTEIIDPLTLRFFLRAMTRTADGRWLVVCQGEQNWFDADVTPLVVQRLSLQAADGAPRDVELHLAGEMREPLDPATLFTDGGDLFCVVGHARHPARFGRVALGQLAPYLKEERGESRLWLNDHTWPIPAVTGRH